MLVTFSGMVGSGKTTNAKKALRWLVARGYQPHYLRFRLLGWRSLWRSPAPAPWVPRGTAARVEKRAAERQAAPRPLQAGRRLTFAVFAGYLLRVVRFRLFVFLHHRHHLLVVNRYFYDNLAHFRLASAAEQRYVRWLHRAMPTPALALLLVLRPETARRRRPWHSCEDLEHLAENVARLPLLCRELQVIRTDTLHTVDHQVEQALCRAFPRKVLRAHEEESHS